MDDNDIIEEPGTRVSIEGQLHTPAVVNGFLLWGVQKMWFQSELVIKTDKRRSGMVLAPHGELIVAFRLSGTAPYPVGGSIVAEQTLYDNIQRIMQQLEENTRPTTNTEGF